MGLRMANGPQWGYAYPGVTLELRFLRQLKKLCDDTAQ